MSDLSQGGAPAEPTGAAGAPPEAATAVDPFDSADTTTFDRAYVAKLREEAAGHRTRAKAAEEKVTRYSGAFDGWEPADADVLLDIVKLAQTDPKAGAKAMQEVAKILAGDVVETPSAPGGEAVTTTITQADLDRILNERDNKAKLAAAVTDIETEAKALGYKPGTADYVKLLWIAQNETDFDLKGADTVIRKERDDAIKAYLDKRAADADGAAGPGPGAGSSISEARPIKTLKDASAATRARLEAMRSRS